MKTCIVVALCLAVAAAAPVSDSEATVVRFDNDNIGVEGYKYAYETSNGISAKEEFHLNNVGSPNEAAEVRGQYSFTGNDGVVYTVTYTADENGFQPQGDHIPVAPVP